MWRILVFLTLLTGTVAAQSPSTSTGAKAAAIVVVKPRYPVDATGRHPTGHGIVVVDVDEKTGWVTAARIEKSTGSKLLDNAALEAFRQWRFSPSQHVRHVRLPINYTDTPKAH